MGISDIAVGINPVRVSDLDIKKPKINQHTKITNKIATINNIEPINF